MDVGIEGNGMKNQIWIEEVLRDLTYFAQANGFAILASDLEIALQTYHIEVEAMETQTAMVLFQNNVLSLDVSMQKRNS